MAATMFPALVGLAITGHAWPLVERGRGRTTRIEYERQVPTDSRRADARTVIGAQLDIDNGGRDLRLPDQSESITHVRPSDNARAGSAKRFANIESGQRLILDRTTRKNTLIFPHGRSPAHSIGKVNGVSRGMSLLKSVRKYTFAIR